MSPGQLLRDVQHAEEAGFEAAMCSDHLAPWSLRQGHSGFAWSWLGAALATTGLRFGCVNAPGQRYHPVIVAQASATLGSMFPGRFWVALGSGEAMNEHVTGDGWPEKEVRQQRLEESVDVIRRLHAGEEVSHDGLVTVHQARVWDLPRRPVPLLAPAVSVDTARRSAAWADGLITVVQPAAVLREVAQTYRGNGGRGPVALQVHLSWAPDEATAEGLAHEQWRNSAVPAPTSWDVEKPQDFDALTADVKPAQLHETVRISADLGQHRAWLAEYAEMGFDEIYLHHVGQEQRAFIDAFAAHVLPALKEA
jgi:probable non-F420 flavinoid oxidoreductase